VKKSDVAVLMDGTRIVKRWAVCWTPSGSGSKLWMLHSPAHAVVEESVEQLDELLRCDDDKYIEDIKPLSYEDVREIVDRMLHKSKDINYGSR